MKFTTLAFVIASTFSLTSVAALADTTSAKTVKAPAATFTDAEQKVVIHVHHVNLMETEMGKLAQKSGTAATKKYGAMLVTDHTTADKALTALAKKRGMATIPDEVPTTEVEKKDAADMMDKEMKLKTLKGADLDALYLPMMVEGHDKELAGQPGWIAAATDADLKAALDKRTTTLTKHRDGAKAILDKAASAATGAAPAPTTTK